MGLLNPCICRMGRLERQAREMLSTGMPVSGTGFRRYFGLQPCRGGARRGCLGLPWRPSVHCPPVCRGLRSGLSGSLRPPGGASHRLARRCCELPLTSWPAVNK